MMAKKNPNKSVLGAHIQFRARDAGCIPTLGLVTIPRTKVDINPPSRNKRGAMKLVKPPGVDLDPVLPIRLKGGLDWFDRLSEVHAKGSGRPHRTIARWSLEHRDGDILDHRVKLFSSKPLTRDHLRVAKLLFGDFIPDEDELRIFGSKTQTGASAPSSRMSIYGALALSVSLPLALKMASDEEPDAEVLRRFPLHSHYAKEPNLRMFRDLSRAAIASLYARERGLRREQLEDFFSREDVKTGMSGRNHVDSIVQHLSPLLDQYLKENPPKKKRTTRQEKASKRGPGESSAQSKVLRQGASMLGEGVPGRAEATAKTPKDSKSKDDKGDKDSSHTSPRLAQQAGTQQSTRSGGRMSPEKALAIKTILAHPSARSLGFGSEKHLGGYSTAALTELANIVKGSGSISAKKAKIAGIEKKRS